MKMQLVGIVACALTLGACQKKGEPAPEAPPSPPVSETAPAAATQEMALNDWVGPRYVIDLAEMNHEYEHVPVGGAVTIKDLGSSDGAGYALYGLVTEKNTAKDDWHRNFATVEMTFESGADNYCVPEMAKLRAEKLAALGAGVPMPTMTDFITARSNSFKLFTAKEPIELHELGSSKHTLHTIVICPIHPDFVKDGHEIYLFTVPTEGGGHDGISHGDD